MSDPRSEMEARVLDLVADIFEVPRGQLSGRTQLDELEEWDSLQHINLAVALEQEFGVAFSAEQMAEMLSVPKILEALESAG